MKGNGGGAAVFEEFCRAKPRTLMERRPGLGRPETGWRGKRNLNSELLYKNTADSVRAARKKQAGAWRGSLQWRIMRGDHGKKDGPALHSSLSRVDTSVQYGNR